jgi:hypothetical protein
MKTKWGSYNILLRIGATNNDDAQFFTHAQNDAICYASSKCLGTVPRAKSAGGTFPRLPFATLR